MNILRRLTLALVVMFCTGLFSAQASADEVKVIIDKSEQATYVLVNGQTKYVWDVSTGKKLRWTPNGSFGVQFLHANHYSSRYNNAPMPWSVFFNGNIAIHGTTEIENLGQPASHGCMRLHPDNARTLFNLVKQVGKQNVHITVQS